MPRLDKLIDGCDADNSYKFGILQIDDQILRGYHGNEDETKYQ